MEDFIPFILKDFLVLFLKSFFCAMLGFILEDFRLTVHFLCCSLSQSLIISHELASFFLKIFSVIFPCELTIDCVNLEHCIKFFLKALLDENIGRNSLCNGHEDDVDSSDDEAIEVFGKKTFLQLKD